MFKRTYIILVKPWMILEELPYLYMTVNEPYAIASNTALDLIMKFSIKALNAYAKDTKKNLNNLSMYAKKFECIKKLQN
jgi:phosphoribosyl-dephospho-CoA transferase